MTDESTTMTDDKRVRIDTELKENVLEPMHSKFEVPMLVVARLCASWAIQNDLKPSPPEKSTAITGDVFAEEPLYRFVSYLYKTPVPRKIAHELMNAGLKDLRDKYQEAESLSELFGLEDSDTSS